MTDNSAPLEVPPGLYFKAKDLTGPRHVDNGASAPDVETGRRNSHLGRCIARVEALARDLRSLKSFDEMGNVELAAEQVSDRLDDTGSLVQELMDDIGAAAARYRRRQEPNTEKHVRGEAPKEQFQSVPSPVPAAEHASLPSAYPPPAPDVVTTVATPATVFGGDRG